MIIHVKDDDQYSITNTCSASAHSFFHPSGCRLNVSLYISLLRSMTHDLSIPLTVDVMEPTAGQVCLELLQIPDVYNPCTHRHASNPRFPSLLRVHM